MKISFFIPTAAFAAATLLFSCTMPESLKVKTSETPYEIPLGDTEVKLSEKFDSEAIQKALGGEEDESDTSSGKQKIYAYEFNPTKTEDSVVEYLMNYKIDEQKIELSTLEGVPNVSGMSDADADAAIDAYLDTIPLDQPLNSFNAKLDTGINFKSILESFAGSGDDGTDYSYIFDKIAFDGIEAYAYIECGDLPKDNAYFTGKIVVGEDESTIDPKTEGTYAELLADSAATADGKFHTVTTNTDIKSLADENGVITDGSFIYDANGNAAYSVELDSVAMTSYMNGTEQSDGSLVKHDFFIIAYDLTPHINFSDKESMKTFLKNHDSISINVNIILRLPLKIRVTGDIVIDDVLDLAGQALDEDLLKRDDGEEFAQKKYTDLIQSLALDYKFKNTTGLSIESAIKANTGATDEKGNTGVFFEGGNPKSFTFDGEAHTISFSKDEINNIFTYSPFMPQIFLKINKTSGTEPIAIKRNSVFGVYALFRMTVEGEVDVWSK